VREIDASDISAPCRFRDLGVVFYEIVNSQIRARRSLRFYDGVSVLDCTLLLATRVNRALGHKNFWICPRLSRSTRQTFSEVRTRRNDTSYEDICSSNRYHQFTVITNDFRLKCNFLNELITNARCSFLIHGYVKRFSYKFIKKNLLRIYFRNSKKSKLRLRMTNYPVHLTNAIKYQLLI